MIDPLLAGSGISISDLKKNPSAVIAAAEGFPVAVLNRNTPAAYLVPAKAWEELMDRLEDFDLADIVRARAGEVPVRSGLTRYRLAFLPSALREWEKLGHTVREQFKAKLAERLTEPRVDAARLSAMPDCYKIKLRAAGYRLVYRVDEGVLTVVVVAVGRRDRHGVYNRAAGRLRG